MDIKQLNEVTEAVNQEYTLEEVYWKIANMDWTIEMFKMFIDKIENQQRKSFKKLF
jgi:hypothetical protein